MFFWGFFFGILRSCLELIFIIKICLGPNEPLSSTLKSTFLIQKSHSSRYFAETTSIIDTDGDGDRVCDSRREPRRGEDYKKRT